MGTIQSTYRFIPVNEKDEYYSPEWKNQVSMDVPFQNAVSGTIKYTLTANTAIFVKGNDGNSCNYDGHYFIPGTSVKGCVRSVLEILSFGHLGEDRVKNNDECFEFRDIADNAKNGHSYMSKMSDVYCGWLTEDGSKIINWGKPCNIKYYATRKEKRWNNEKKKNETITIILPDAKKEYLISKIKKIADIDCFAKYKSLKQLEFSFTEPNRLPNAGSYDQRLFCRFGGTNRGTLFFSGAIETKESDFVLLDKNIQRGEINVPPDVFNSLKKIYAANKEKNYPGWTEIPISKSKGGRPVFFTKSGTQAVSIGLSYLHKYFVKNNIRDAVPAKLRGGKGLDLADVMFGNTDNYRGRIQFGAAKGDMSTCKLLMRENNSLLAVLGSPRASYYPTYLQDRKTWDSDSPTISGIKRYPIKPTYDVSALELNGKDLDAFRTKFGNDFTQMFQFNDAPLPEKETDRDNGIYNFDTVVNLNPLKEGAVFEGYIHFFNLKKEELGALLSALTFHGREDKCKHSLGMAKSAGYGSTSIKLTKLEINGEDKLNEKQFFLDAFKNLMTSRVNPNWENTPRLRELFAMAEGFSDESMAYDFKSMVLKDFAKAKQQYMKFDRHTGTFGNDFLSYTETMQKYGMKSTSPTLSTNASKPKSPISEEIAIVLVYDRNIRQVSLISKPNLKLNLSTERNEKLKIGDKIKVKVFRNGNGKIEKTEFVSKLNN